MDGGEIHVIIVEMKSIQPIEKKKTDHRCRLKKKVFLSLSQPKGVYKEKDNTA